MKIEFVPEMREAAEKYLEECNKSHPLNQFSWEKCFNEMLSAAPTPPEIEPVAEIVSEELGQPFSAEQIRAHLYKKIPPVGTKLYASPSPADDELRKAAEEAHALLVEIDKQVTLTEDACEVMDDLRAALNKGKS